MASTQDQKHWGGCLSFGLLSIPVALGALCAIFVGVGAGFHLTVFLILKCKQFKSGLCRIVPFNSHRTRPLIRSLEDRVIASTSKGRVLSSLTCIASSSLPFLPSHFF